MFKQLAPDSALPYEHLDAGDVLLFFSLPDCPPCEVLSSALESDLPAITVYQIKPDATDKRAIGCTVPGGITKFPRLELYRQGALASVSAVGADLAAHLRRWLRSTDRIDVLESAG